MPLSMPRKQNHVCYKIIFYQHQQLQQAQSNFVQSSDTHGIINNDLGCRAVAVGASPPKNRWNPCRRDGVGKNYSGHCFPGQPQFQPQGQKERR